MSEKPRVTVVCGWGDGVDVLVTNKGMSYMLYDKPSGFKTAVHGYSESGSVALTRQEARDLAKSLLRAADLCDEMDEAYEEHLKYELSLKNEDA